MKTNNVEYKGPINQSINVIKRLKNLEGLSSGNEELEKIPLLVERDPTFPAKLLEIFPLNEKEKMRSLAIADPQKFDRIITNFDGSYVYLEKGDQKYRINSNPKTY